MRLPVLILALAGAVSAVNVEVQTGQELTNDQREKMPDLSGDSFCANVQELYR
jgi:hypothetical protein